MVNDSEIVRVGRNHYCLPNDKRQVYRHDYSELAEEVALQLEEQYPYLNFTIFEFVQMNDFVNHLVAHNVIRPILMVDICRWIDKHFSRIFLL